MGARVVDECDENAVMVNAGDEADSARPTRMKEAVTPQEPTVTMTMSQIEDMFDRRLHCMVAAIKLSGSNPQPPPPQPSVYSPTPAQSYKHLTRLLDSSEWPEGKKVSTSSSGYDLF